MSAPPPCIIILTIISLLVAIPMTALSVVDIGMSSMSSMWSNSTAASLDLLYQTVFLIVVFINRKDFSSASEHHTEGAEDKSSDYFDVAPSKPPSIAFSNWNIISLTFLLAVNFIAFSVMAHDTTVLGAMGGNHVESFGLDFKIQVALTVTLGCELLTIATILAISAWGRRRIVLEEENRLQEAQYEFWNHFSAGQSFFFFSFSTS